jgi:menaquinone-dependent protoporphyrinogen IX oxidase
MEGQTRKIANAIAARIHELGQDAHVIDLASLEDAHVSSYDRMTVTASVHQRRHQGVGGSIRHGKGG